MATKRKFGPLNLERRAQQMEKRGYFAEAAKLYLQAADATNAAYRHSRNLVAYQRCNQLAQRAVQ